MGCGSSSPETTASIHGSEAPSGHKTQNSSRAPAVQPQEGVVDKSTKGDAAEKFQCTNQNENQNGVIGNDEHSQVNHEAESKQSEEKPNSPVQPALQNTAAVAIVSEDMQHDAQSRLTQESDADKHSNHSGIPTNDHDDLERSKSGMSSDNMQQDGQSDMTRETYLHEQNNGESTNNDLERSQSVNSSHSGGSQALDGVVALAVAQEEAQQKSLSPVGSDDQHLSEKQNSDVVCVAGENAADNIVTENDDLPYLPPPARPADFDCLYGHSKGKWPIRNFAKTGFNVNAQHGGCAFLMVCSCSYGGKGPETTAELFFFSSGFDCNHWSNVSIKRSNSGHFGCENKFKVEEDGHLLGNLMFGTNDVMLLTNDSQYGTLKNGVYVEGTEIEDEWQPLNIDVNASGNCLVLCSASEASVGDSKLINGAYMVRTGFKDNFVEAKNFFGDDKWKFEANENGILAVKGPSRSNYTFYHNRPEQIQRYDNLGKPYVLQTQATDGSQRTVILPKIPGKGALIVLCSNSKGTEKATAAAMYMVTMEANEEVSMKSVCSLAGDNYETADLWKIEKSSGKLVIIGPSGPCRYAVISNIRAEGAVKFCQDLCLATGEPQPIRGIVEMDEDVVKGIVDKPSKVYIQVDHKIIVKFHPDDLKRIKNGWGFCRKWKEGEITVGLHTVKVLAVREHVTTGEEQFIHITGSPKQIVKQKQGVIYALNCGGPAYTAINDVTYSSEHRQFASFTYDFNCGSEYTSYGKGYSTIQIPQLMCKTHDGYMYSTARSPGIEPLDEQKINYVVEDLPNGNFTFRVHLQHRASRNETLKVNGEEIVHKILEASQRTKDVIPEHKGYTAYYADAPISISSNRLIVNVPRNPGIQISAFAVMDKTYSEKIKTEEEKRAENDEKLVLVDKTEPLQRSMRRKELTIVGWSQNLLKNASGENGDLSHWNTTGNWALHEGGYGTEKAFKTSHMECQKYQEVNLLEHFAAEYLDTSPEIQVSEWYREGVCGGGHYKMDVVLMDEDGNIIKEYSTGMSGRIYNDNKWIQSEVSFTDYGPGARIVGLSSTGKDDKYWGGHYGTIISASCIRVKRESMPASDDAFTDINMDHASDGSDWSAKRDSLVAKVLTDNQDLLKELLEEDAVPSLGAEFEKQTEITQAPNRKKRQARKKREIRVFVSSTFKDFSREREQIIKKTFREINRLCADRGVFFSYVDLRWGISTEQTEDGKTIAICLQEIERCRPYFLCLMGYRFGWSQQEENIDKTLNASYDYAVENYPSLKWIDNYRYNVSVTQLEVLHGVLNNVDNLRDRSFFYLRSPVKQEDVPEKDYKKYISESEWHQERQESLRNTVKETPGLNIRPFVSPEEASDLIKEDLQWCVEQDFPLGTELSPLEREREAHQAFADARCRVYIGRDEYFVQIDSNLGKELKQPFVLLGESGSGKSALVANWVKRVRDRQPNWFVFVHFIGSSAESASYIKLLRRLYEEIKEFFNFDLAIPTSDANLISELSKWLHLASTRGKCVIVFDALNQLDDGTGSEGPEHDLLWIPKDLPSNMFLLLSTLPGKAMDAIQKLEWPSMRVEPLDPSQKMEIITGYLEGLYSKTLSKEQKQMIVDVPQTNNPLYLKSLLDEVRVYGSFRNLTKKIEEYLMADSPGDLFAKILDRLEMDFEKEDEQSKALVRETTIAIWCSHRGMAESELIDLLGVPSVIWSPFYLSIEENLVNRNGILNFFHDHLRQAVQIKYLSTPEERRKGYLKLADFFEQKELDDRVVDELPFLLARGGDLERLRKTISNLDVFKIMVKTEDGMFDLIKSWKLLGDFTQVENIYLSKLSEIPESQRHSESYSKLLDDLGTFFVQIGLFGAARNVYEKLIQDLESRYAVSHGTVVYSPSSHDWKYRSQHPDVINALHKLGLVCEKQMELDAGVKYYRDAISRQNRITTPSQKLKLCEGLLGLASIYYLQEHMQEAKKLLVRCLELATDVLGQRHHYVAAILNKLGQFCYTQSRLDEALGYQLQDLKLTRSEVGLSHPRIAGIFNDVALVYDDKNDKLAVELYESALIILLDMYGAAHVDIATVRYNLGAYYFATNYFAKAKYQFQESYGIFKSFLGDEHPDTVAAKTAFEEVAPMAKG